MAHPYWLHWAYGVFWTYFPGYFSLSFKNLRRSFEIHPQSSRPGAETGCVFYLLDAMRLFRGKSLQEIKEIAFGIGLVG